MKDTQPGRVVISYGQEAIVETADGLLQRCKLRRRVGRPVCGDYVAWRASSESDGVIERIEPRQNVVARPDYRAKLRPLAANVDLMVIVVAVEPEFTRELIDRYLVLAESLEIKAALWVNKIDLLSVEARRDLEDSLASYRELGYPVDFGSTTSEASINPLREGLRDATSVLVGQSGVGKSSLVNTLLPDQQVRVGALSHASGQGRHTTTETTLYHLPDGGHLIDSPGIRTLRLGHLNPEQIEHGFIEFRAFHGQCKFNNCRHINEPGCAIAAAAQAGAINHERLESFRTIIAAEEKAY
ncbi:small ribosomal subunit biogenesis GTPase RsgA [Alkalilimnicola ehrlichii]|nr:small ribosomal subunit biogenesis GTPase RsgA [Alkalilimnicola ehrlichii]